MNRAHLALTTIAEMPLPEQDNMISAAMRKIAVEALPLWRPITEADDTVKYDRPVRRPGRLGESGA